MTRRKRAFARRLYCLGLAALLCAAMALSAFAYPAGVDESLPRVIDNANLLTASEKSLLEARVAALVSGQKMDVVLLTTNSLDGKTPAAYTDDFFDYRGYGWREAETNDITAGSGILVLVNMGERDLYFSTKGEGEKAFYDNALNHMYDSMRAQLGEQKYAAAFSGFLDDVEGYLGDYHSGTKDYYNANGGDTFVEYDDGKSGVSPGAVVFVGLLLALLIAWLAVRSMKRKLNTARPQAAALNYMTQGSFRLTQQQDIFLFSNTTRTARPQQSSSGSGGGGFSSSGSHTSSSGSSHGGGGGKF